jgi:hypothetical protein
MKKVLVLILALAIMALLPAGCGKDGAAGLAYLALDWVGLPFYYNDTNAGTPFTVYQGVEYQSQPGTYNFDYKAWDGTVWVGTYKIEVNAGEKGGLIANGADGADRHYTLWLYSTGPSLLWHEAVQQRELQLLQEAGKEKSFETELSGSPSAMEYTLDSQVFVEELIKGDTTIRIEYQRAHLKN